MADVRTDTYTHLSNYTYLRNSITKVKLSEQWEYARILKGFKNYSDSRNMDNTFMLQFQAFLLFLTLQQIKKNL